MMFPMNSATIWLFRLFVLLLFVSGTMAHKQNGRNPNKNLQNQCPPGESMISFSYRYTTRKIRIRCQQFDGCKNVTNCTWSHSCKKSKLLETVASDRIFVAGIKPFRHPKDAHVRCCPAHTYKLKNCVSKKVKFVNYLRIHISNRILGKKHNKSDLVINDVIVKPARNRRASHEVVFKVCSRQRIPLAYCKPNDNKKKEKENKKDNKEKDNEKNENKENKKDNKEKDNEKNENKENKRDNKENENKQNEKNNKQKEDGQNKKAENQKDDLKEKNMKPNEKQHLEENAQKESVNNQMEMARGPQTAEEEGITGLKWIECFAACPAAAATGLYIGVKLYSCQKFEVDPEELTITYSDDSDPNLIPVRGTATVECTDPLATLYGHSTLNCVNPFQWDIYDEDFPYCYYECSANLDSLIEGEDPAPQIQDAPVFDDDVEYSEAIDDDKVTEDATATVMCNPTSTMDFNLVTKTASGQELYNNPGVATCSKTTKWTVNGEEVISFECIPRCYKNLAEIVDGDSSAFIFDYPNTNAVDDETSVTVTCRPNAVNTDIDDYDVKITTYNGGTVEYGNPITVKCTAGIWTFNEEEIEKLECPAKCPTNLDTIIEGEDPQAQYQTAPELVKDATYDPAGVAGKVSEESTATVKCNPDTPGDFELTTNLITVPSLNDNPSTVTCVDGKWESSGNEVTSFECTPYCYKDLETQVITDQSIFTFGYLAGDVTDGTLIDVSCKLKTNDLTMDDFIVSTKLVSGTTQHEDTTTIKCFNGIWTIDEVEVESLECHHYVLGGPGQSCSATCNDVSLQCDNPNMPTGTADYCTLMEDLKGLPHGTYGVTAGGWEEDPGLYSGTCWYSSATSTCPRVFSDQERLCWCH